MKLVLITKPTFFVEEDKIIASLFEEGLDNLHLYKPDSSPMYAERLLSLLPEDYYRKITVHDHYYLKSEYHLAGIHIEHPEDPVPEGYRGRTYLSGNRPAEGGQEKGRICFPEVHLPQSE